MAARRRNGGERRKVAPGGAGSSGPGGAGGRQGGLRAAPGAVTTSPSWRRERASVAWRRQGRRARDSWLGRCTLLLHALASTPRREATPLAGLPPEPPVP